MRIPSGKIDQSINFVAFDSTDKVTRKTGLSGFAVYRSRNGAAPVLYTTPTVVELSAANMPGVYALLVDEDTTIASASDSEEYCVHITVATMAPVTRTIELFRRDTTSGNTALVDSNGRVDVIKVAGTTQSAGDIYARLGAPAGASMSADTAATFARLGAPAGASVSVDIAAIKTVDDAVKAKTDNLPASPAAVGSAMTLTAGERNSCADALLARNIAGGSSSGRIVTDALRFLRNKWAIAAGTLTVYQEDDSTSAWTAAVSSDASAVPIVGNDPA